MKKILLMNIMAVAAMALFASGVMAQNAPWVPSTFVVGQGTPADFMGTFQGVIQGVDRKDDSMVVGNGSKDMTFYWEKDTVFNGAGQMPVSRLERGEKISLRYMQEGDRLIARVVNVQSSIGSVGLQTKRVQGNGCTSNC